MMEEYEEKLEKTKEILEIQENQLFIYKEMTNLSIEIVESDKESIECYECHINSFTNPKSFLRFRLFFNEKENEIQYIPIEVRMNLGINQVFFLFFVRNFL